MAGVKSRSLHDLLVVLLVSALGGLAVVAVTVHHWLVAWQMRRLVDQQATTLAKLLGGQARRMLLANDRAGLKRWAREVSGQGRIVAAAVFGPAGAAQAIGYTDRAWLSYFEAPWANDDGAWAPGQASKLQQVSGQRGSVYRLDVPIRASMGGQRIGMVSILWRPDAGGLTWLFGLVIAAASVVAFGLLWWRLGRRLLEPLEVLGRAALTGAQPP
ncbi:MAG: hypothetical protein ACE5K7_05705, partial [Phycisphaerae bacterium]